MFTKGKSPDNPPTPQQPTPPPAGVDKRPPMAGSRSGPSLISADVKITGSIVSQGELQIDGHIDQLAQLLIRPQPVGVLAERV